ncbi:MAG: tetratricopeptide repeat protein [Pseudomonadota bacterium]
MNKARQRDGTDTEIANWLQESVSCHQGGDLDRAAAGYRRILAAAPDHGDALHLLGLIHLNREAYEAAVDLIEQALRHYPDTALYHNSLGMALMGQSVPAQARKHFDRALELKPDYLEAWFNLGRLLRSVGEAGRAVSCLQKVISIDAGSAMAHAEMGELLLETGHGGEAAECFKRALVLEPEYLEARHNLGIALHDSGRLEAAVSVFEEVIARRPGEAQAYNHLGVVLHDLGRKDAAKARYQKALEIDPTLTAAHNNLGNLLQDAGHMAAAADCYHRAIAIDPGFAVAHNNLAMAYQETGQAGDAIAHFQKAITLRPGYAEACAHLVHQLQRVCDWDRLTAAEQRLDALTGRALSAGQPVAEQPFVSLVRGAAPDRQLHIARSWADRAARLVSGSCKQFSHSHRTRTEQPITLGYLSANFRNHPMAHLMASLFELHDRSRFRVHAYAFGADDNSDYRRRIAAGCDRFIDIETLDHGKAAARIHADGVDILIDLMGHTKGNRMAICALRPSPIQVRYLGLAGTSGATFFDYIVCDRTVVPEALAAHYSEHPIYMPHCYQVNDHRQPVSERPWTRQEAGLPENGPVLCCFNHTYKIDARVFHAWMTVLDRVPDAVLWLLETTTLARENLLRHAILHGISADRLVFAKKVPKPEHLSRLKLADLALDTRVVSGAATTSDALWAGVPVITIRGRQFAENMSASILAAVGLPELVTEGLDDFTALAARLASDPPALGVVREKLARNLKTAPLFDTRRFARNLEAGFHQIWHRHVSGLAPEPICILEPASPVPLSDKQAGGDRDAATKAGKCAQTSAHRQRLAVFCRTGAHFLSDIMGHLKRTHEIRIFEGNSVGEMADLMKWCDIAWFEWCDDAVVKASALPKQCRIVCRLHSYEAFGDVPSRVTWENVDALIFVAPHVREIVEARVPDLARRVPIHVIYNGVNLARFTFRNRQRGYDMASVGYINHKKNPSLLLQCIRALVDVEPRFRLHVAGTHQEERFRLYVDHMILEMGLTEHVLFHGWVEDMNEWLADKHYLVSTSVFESFGYGIAEAMAAGIKPLIHNFPGARRLFPEKLLFNTVGDMVRMTLEDDYQPAVYRRFIEDHYRVDGQLKEIEKVLAEITDRRN